MKWGGYNRDGEERMKRLFSGKLACCLLTALLLVESTERRLEGRG